MLTKTKKNLKIQKSKNFKNRKKILRYVALIRLTVSEKMGFTDGRQTTDDGRPCNGNSSADAVRQS